MRRNAERGKHRALGSTGKEGLGEVMEGSGITEQELSAGRPPGVS